MMLPPYFCVNRGVYIRGKYGLHADGPEEDC